MTGEQCNNNIDEEAKLITGKVENNIQELRENVLEGLTEHEQEVEEKVSNVTEIVVQIK